MLGLSIWMVPGLCLFDGMRELVAATRNMMTGVYLLFRRCYAGMAAKAVDLLRAKLESRARPKAEPNHMIVSTWLMLVCNLGGVPIQARRIQDYMDARLCGSSPFKFLNNHTTIPCLASLLCTQNVGIRKVPKPCSAGGKKIRICYSSMISAFGMHGCGKDAIAVFNALQDKDLGHSFAASACSHAGLFDEGCQGFQMMEDGYHIIPTVKHYLCMVDLLGHAGRMHESYQ